MMKEDQENRVEITIRDDDEIMEFVNDYEEHKEIHIMTALASDDTPLKIKVAELLAEEREYTSSKSAAIISQLRMKCDSLYTEGKKIQAMLQKRDTHVDNLQKDLAARGSTIILNDTCHEKVKKGKGEKVLAIIAFSLGTALGYSMQFL